MISPETDSRERRNAWIILLVCPTSLLCLCIPTLLGISPGIDAGHPPEYLIMTCMASAVLSILLPLFRLLRLASVPRIVYVVVYVNIYLYLVSLHLGMYMNVSWWSDFTHIISSTITAIIVFLGICVMQELAPPNINLESRTGITILVFVLALSFGAIWEMAEGLIDYLSGQPYMVYGTMDSLNDMIADAIGALMVSVAVFLTLGRHAVSHISATVRFGRAPFMVEGA